MRNAIKVSKPILEDNNLTNIIEVSENLKNILDQINLQRYMMQKLLIRKVY